MVRYISDFDGNNVITSKKNSLNLSEQTNSVVSDYMGYGSFSGADIKVVVHYPYSRKAEQALLKERNKLEARLEDIPTVTTPAEWVYAKLEVASITTQLDLLDEELKSIQNMPTSKVLGELQTISYSIFREKAPVRTLGSVYPRAYVRGSS